MPNNRFDLTGRQVILTGGLGLLGRDFTKSLVQCGARVIILDLMPTAQAKLDLAGFLTPLEREHVAYYTIDITNKAALESLKHKILSKFKKIDVLINNAALNPAVKKRGHRLSGQSFKNTSLSDWQKMINVNLTGTMLCCQVFGEILPRGGSVINIASLYGVQAPDQRIYKAGFIKPAAYTVSKAGVIALTRYLAAYWGERGIRVNSLSPGGVEADQGEDFVKKYSYRVPLGRMAKINEISGSVIFLCSPASTYISGVNLIVDGGASVW